MIPKIIIPRHILPHKPNTDPLWILANVLEAMRANGYLETEIAALKDAIEHPGKMNHTEMLDEMRKYVDFEFASTD
jgi:hypothetical protein